MDALFCKIVIAPVFQESIETILCKQASLIAKERVNYLKGTMNLEQQAPTDDFLKKLYKQEFNELLHTSGTKLWQ